VITNIVRKISTLKVTLLNVYFTLLLSDPIVFILLSQKCQLVKFRLENLQNGKQNPKCIICLYLLAISFL